MPPGELGADPSVRGTERTYPGHSIILAQRKLERRLTSTVPRSRTLRATNRLQD